MIKQHNIFESVFTVSTVICISLASLHCLTGFFGVWLPLCSVLLFVFSVFITFRTLRRLLEFTKPIKYEEVFKNSSWKFLGSLISIHGLYPKNPTKNEWKEYDTRELSIISTVLERRLVSSWYSEFVSRDIAFPFACKELLDHAIGKAFHITYKIDTPSLYIDVCSVLLSHINEYKRAEKLLQLGKEGSFEQHYRFMHPVFSNQNGGKKKRLSADHCANILRVLMKDLIPFDLWNTPHSELLIRILTKRLDKFIKETLSNPKWLNKKLLQLLRGIDKPDAVVEKSQPSVKIEPEILTQDKENVGKIAKDRDAAPDKTLELDLADLISQSTAPVIPKAVVDNPEPGVEIKIQEIPSDLNLDATHPCDVQSSPVLRQRRGRQGMNEVKIYDRIIEGSVQTWDTDVDLRCVSVGQDLLANLDGEIGLSRLWETDAQEADGWSPNPQGQQSPPALWFGEEDTMDLDLDSSPKSANVRAEPSFVFPHMADLQSTVNQAKHKIGDLQDEAAGVMEGILDFGIAGLRKGLRMTGLHEGNQDKLPTTPVQDKFANGRATPPEHSPNKHSSMENGRKTSPTLSSDDPDDNIIMSSSAQLVKQHRIVSQDTPPLAIPRRAGGVEDAAKLGVEGDGRGDTDSPEPEYEEAADFASSIAKLRDLLQQRSGSDKPEWPEDRMQWDGAEETRGRTQHARHAGRPVDTATLADEYDVSAENQQPGQSTNNMQRLDRLLQRTVTGVLNSIKTAVGGEVVEETSEEQTPPADWQFVCTSLDTSVSSTVSRYLASRRARLVEPGFDSLELAPRATTPPPDVALPPPVDLEEWCATWGGCWGGSAELAAAAGLWQSHVTHTLATVLFGDVAEGVLCAWLHEFSPWLRAQVFLAFEHMVAEDQDSSDNEEGVDVERIADAILDKLPKSLWVFDEATLREAVHLVLLAFGSARVNSDLAFRLLDVLALHAARVVAAA